jgi:hypothetical protein
VFDSVVVRSFHQFVVASRAQHHHILHSIAVGFANVNQMMQRAPLVYRLAAYLAAVACYFKPFVTANVAGTASALALSIPHSHWSTADPHMKAEYLELFNHVKNKSSNFRLMVRASGYLYEPFNILPCNLARRMMQSKRIILNYTN